MKASEIFKVAEDLGFSPRQTVFEEVPPDTLYRIAGYKIPGNYHSWQHGRDYWVAKQRFVRGSGTIMEMVLNTEPAWAYIADNLNDVQHTEVIAHVAAHAHHFDACPLLRNSRLDILAQARGARERFLEYEARYGLEPVEKTIDAAHAVMWHSEYESPRPEFPEPERQIIVSPYSDLLGDRRVVENKVDRHTLEMREQALGDSDFLRYTIQYAPIQDWQKDILDTIRTQALYFHPIIQAKVIAEGIASWGEVKILNALGLDGNAAVESALSFMRVVAGDRFMANPYRVGVEFFRAIEKLGKNPLDAVREHPTSVAMFRNLLTRDVLREMNMHTWVVGEEDENGVPVLVSRVADTEEDAEFIRNAVVQSIDMRSRPCVPGTMQFDGAELDILFNDYVDRPYAELAAKQLAYLWECPVNIPQANISVDGGDQDA